MMHTLRNRKTGRKSARWRFTEARRTSETAFIRISQARSRTLIQISRPLWASKPGCDAHICLNLGFTSQNFRLTQASRHVCYFWSSPFGMDEGDTVPVTQEVAGSSPLAPATFHSCLTERIKPRNQSLKDPQFLPCERQRAHHRVTHGFGDG